MKGMERVMLWGSEMHKIHYELSYLMTLMEKYKKIQETIPDSLLSLAALCLYIGFK